MTVFLCTMGLIDLALLFLLARQWPRLTLTGRVAMGGLVFAALPLIYGFAVILNGLQSMKSVTFCGSCHVMQPYVLSLDAGDEESLPAIHYQNNWVPRENACYDCHSEYGMFGDLKAKLNGLKHVYVNYVPGPPSEIKLYLPYRNDDCLHCHGPSKRFREWEDHMDNEQEIKSGETSCLDCHDLGHVLDPGG